MSADIFVFPTHINTPSSTLIDAMSYELPIVTTDTWANSEFVKDGVTSFIVHNPRSVRYEEGPIMHLCSNDFIREILTGKPEPEVVKGLVDKISTLIANPQLRQKMGVAGRNEVEEGKFSINKRNQELKSIFDSATA